MRKIRQLLSKLPILDRFQRKVRVAIKISLGREPRVNVTKGMPLALFGKPEYGWSIPTGVLSADSVIVDVGIGEDLSFSQSIQREYGCSVHCLDPTPRALAYARSLQAPELKIHPVGLDHSCGSVELNLPINTSHVSGTTIAAGHTGTEAVLVDMIDITTLLALVGGRIDLLKIDIEGSEYGVIDDPAFPEVAKTIAIVCIEFHHRWPEVGIEKTIRAVSTLEACGFVCAWRNSESNEEFTFVNRSYAPA